MEFELRYVEDTVKSIYYKLSDVTVIMGDDINQLKDDVEHCRNFVKLNIEGGKFIDPDGTPHKYCYMDPNLLVKSAFLDGYKVEVFEDSLVSWVPIDNPDWDETKLYRAIIRN